MVSLSVLLYIQANLVTVQASPDDGCPTGPQVADALALRVPGLVVDALPPRTQSENATAELAEGLVLRLASKDNVLTVELVDRAGQVRLVRRLPQSPKVTPVTCAALADTVALVALRFLTELGVVVGELPAQQPPHATPPPASLSDPKVRLEETVVITNKIPPNAAPILAETRRIELDLAFGGRTGRTALGSIEAALSARRLSTGIAPWLAEIRLTANGSEPLHWQNADQSDGSGSLSSYGLEAAFGKRWVGSDARHAWDLAGWAGVQWLRLRESGPAERVESASEGAAGVQVAWSLSISERLFLRLGARVGVNLTRHVVEGPDGFIFDTSRFRGAANVGAGVRF